VDAQLAFKAADENKNMSDELGTVGKLATG